MEKTQIAILITCHNRREITLGCLNAINNLKFSNPATLQVYLVDAGSTDGTTEAVREHFPEVNLIPCNDDLFWCGGMRVAFENASRASYDYYLWLNDDTKVLPDSIQIMLKTAREIRKREGRDAIIVGSTYDPKTGELSYGGLIQLRVWPRIRFDPVKPSDRPQKCDTMNGNCVLIPVNVAKLIGNISHEFTHRIGDIDYGLRAKSEGIPIWITSGYVGSCARNPLALWTDPLVPVRDRLKFMKSPKGLPPHEWMIFTKRHMGCRWPLHLLKLYMYTLFPRFFKQLNK